MSLPLAAPPTGRSRGLRKLRQLLWIGFGILAVIGWFGAESREHAAAYLLICATAMLPARIWLKAGTPGVPILPTAALIHILFYAAPILTMNYDTVRYDTREVLVAGATVALYLLCAAVAYWAILSKLRRRGVRTGMFTLKMDRFTVHFCLGGLWVSLIFHVALVQGWLAWTGGAFGLLRAVVFSVAFVSCFLLGMLIGQRKLGAKYRHLSVVLLCVTVVLSWSSLLLVMGVMMVATAMAAYFIAARRVSLLALALFLSVIYVLHAGKAEMRDRYWYGDNRMTSVVDVPGFYLEWFGRGFSRLVREPDRPECV